jgi:hypothetical protein
MMHRAILLVCFGALACGCATPKDTIPTEESAACGSGTWRVLVYNDGTQGRNFYYSDLGTGRQFLGFVERGQSRLFTVTTSGRPSIWVRVTRTGGVITGASIEPGLVGPQTGDFRAYSNCQ